mgnify:CR=1 FL=1
MTMLADRQATFIAALLAEDQVLDLVVGTGFQDVVEGPAQGPRVDEVALHLDDFGDGHGGILARGPAADPRCGPSHRRAVVPAVLRLVRRAQYERQKSRDEGEDPREDAEDQAPADRRRRGQEEALPLFV